MVDAIEITSIEKRNRLTIGLHRQNVIAVVNLPYSCWVLLSSALAGSKESRELGTGEP
jgi:hypothetical protein